MQKVPVALSSGPLTMTVSGVQVSLQAEAFREGFVGLRRCGVEVE